MEKFAFGVLVGGMLGALLVANNNKMRTLVKKAQAESQEKWRAFMDEKMEMVEEGLDKASEKMDELSQKAKDKLSKKSKSNA